MAFLVFWMMAQTKRANPTPESADGAEAGQGSTTESVAAWTIGPDACAPPVEASRGMSGDAGASVVPPRSLGNRRLPGVRPRAG